MSDLAYFEYALVLPGERYLIEVKTRNPYSGGLYGQPEIEDIANECFALTFGGRTEDQEVKANPISQSNAQVSKKVQEILKRPDNIVYRVE